MNNITKSKKIASFLEIIIMYSIFTYISTKTYSKYFLEESLYNNSLKSKKNVYLTSFLSSKSSDSFLNSLIYKNIKNIFKPILNYFYYITEIFNKIFGNLVKSIDKIRNLTKPIRLFFKNSAEFFYRKINKFIIGITYSLHKLRNSMKRTVSGFTMVLHTIQTLNLSLQSIMNSPLVSVTKKFVGAIEWLEGAFDTIGLCFSGETIIDTPYGNIAIKDIIPGLRISENNYVISTFKILNNNSNMYNINNILVSGSHLVNLDNKWLRVEECKNAMKIDSKNDKYIYCLNTTQGIIEINNIIFKDFSESGNLNINYYINNIILKNLNGTNEILNINKPNYLEQGMHSDTLINMGNNFKYIKDIEIGDYLYNSKVVGIVKINSENLELYCYRDKYIFSENIKVNEYDLWINVADSMYSRKIDKLKDFTCDILYHLIVDTGKLYLEDLEITDYLESHDKIINDKIDNIIKNYNNNISDY
tara:strand:- start:10748 stop:12172 length:1425 start_codon:yes stop_codon:yes gene_type:complete